MVEAADVSFGSYLPKRFVTNEEIESWHVKKDAEGKKLLTASGILDVTGIERRYIPDESESIVRMALEAISKTGWKSFDALRVCSSYPYGEFIAERIAQEWGINVDKCDLKDRFSACTGFADIMVELKENEKQFLGKKVMIVASEDYSKTIVHPKEEDSYLKDPSWNFDIFSGGAFATAFEFGKALKIDDYESCGLGGQDNITMPSIPDYMVGNYSFYPVKFSLRFQQDGHAVYRAVRKFIPQTIARVGDQSGEKPNIIWVHSGSGRIVNVLQQDLSKISEDFDGKVYQDYTDGNFSSGSIPRSMKSAFDEGKLSKGTKFRMSGFGAGMRQATLSGRFG